MAPRFIKLHVVPRGVLGEVQPVPTWFNVEAIQRFFDADDGTIVDLLDSGHLVTQKAADIAALIEEVSR